MSKKFNRLTLTFYSVGALTIGLAALSIVGNLALLFAVATLISFGFGILIVTLNTLISLNTPKDAQGDSLGVAWAIAGLAQTIAPVFAASAFSFGVSTGFDVLVFVISAAISVATVPLVLLFKKSVFSAKTDSKESLGA